jgi:putative hydrolase of the HAD superfamily
MKHGFSRGFDAVFNSYHVHATKHEPGFFHTALEQMQTAPGATLFVDDSAANVDVARSAGLAAIHYRDRDSFFAELSGYLPGIAEQVAKQVTRAEKGAIQ